MFRTAVLVSAALVVGGCNPVGETADRHAVHSGETAVITHKRLPKVYAAVEKHDAHEVTRAVEDTHIGKVTELVKSGKAVEIETGTPVVVDRESNNERYVRVQAGTSAGKRVWVPYEWLKPAH